MTGRHKNSEAKFWSKVNQQDPRFCWRWTGSYRGGYGRYSENYRSIDAHRYAWICHNGPIPDEMEVMHRCNNKACCNPLHLELGTGAQNTQDAYRDRLAPSGEHHHKAKLTEGQVSAILQDNRTQTAIAEDYGVRQTTISRIKQRKNWRHADV